MDSAGLSRGEDGSQDTLECPASHTPQRKGEHGSGLPEDSAPAQSNLGKSRQTAAQHLLKEMQSNPGQQSALRLVSGR